MACKVTFRRFDIRKEKHVYSAVGHTSEVLALDFNRFNEHLIVTGSADSTVGLWDKRNLKQKVHVFKGHKDEVNCLKFSPHHEGLLASGSADRRLIVWDMALINQPLSQPEDE